jgi:hypothetical protein
MTKNGFQKCREISASTKGESREKKEVTGATVRNYVKTIKLFCEMSDLLLPWKKITRLYMFYRCVK